MAQYEQIITQPIFFLFVAFSVLLAWGYFWGRRRNHRIFASAFEDLLQVFKPDDQKFTNIGGAIGYHANLYIRKKKAFLSQVDATITMLPRHSLLYLPISKLIRKYDRLFVELYLKSKPKEECHLLEQRYSRFAGTKISNIHKLHREKLVWGKYDFELYYESLEARQKVLEFISRNPDPGGIRHIALVPEQIKCFIFMIPRKGQVAQDLAPVYTWLPSLSKSP
ncbi:MAG: hypothetical protein R6U22_05425 [Desulfohalobiaceae bacterium]